MAQVSFIAIDWGTSSFRLWALAADGSVVAATDGPFGMSRLKRGDFGNVLEENLAKLNIDPNVPVIICGMAGAKQGWCEAPYLQVPTRLDAMGMQAVKVQGIDRDIHILPGAKQILPANVMRGEETQIAGFLHHCPDFEGTVCLPGTHSKWVRVSDKSIQDFETCMTGEQFAFFSQQSVLSHSMLVDGWCDESFDRAILSATTEPHTVPCKLFAIRAEMLIGEQSSAKARSRLSGLLIGQELVATKPYWRANEVVLIGATPLCKLYIQALEILGVKAKALDSTTMTLLGLCAAHKFHNGVGISNHA
ncbi:2-dehydro-3-deoxygalactonokinase [Ahrensia kielensis]|uniref:2-dehydro-3-deoxygalactonokinase n=1 Tax=Ahrensia kielensis TaxID=76980 RepID=A0ABU9TAC2_9HYPH